ncbi:cupredoxin domain-containing protein [Pseudomonas mohnii]
MSKTLILNIQNNTFPMATIRPGTYVVWRNLDPYPHSAETENNADFFFNAGPLLPGEVSPPVLFSGLGDFPYRCRYHAGMSSMVHVRVDAPVGGIAENASVPDHEGHGVHGGHGTFNHLHGFITGGRTGQRFFMSHTPVLADSRHSYQVILQGSLTTPEHIQAYEAVRNSNYGDRRVQILHSHTSLPDIRDGITKVLPKASFTYYPDLAHPDDGVDIPGLKENIPVSIDKVLHFHTFDVDDDSGDGSLRYLIYGDMDDIFIDHFMNKAPSFHSVAKLASAPSFWTATQMGGVVQVSVPAKRIEYLSPKLIQRIAFVDNSFHVFWLPPSGLYAPTPLDPLFPRKAFNRAKPSEFNGGPFRHEVVLVDGTVSQIDLARSLHFDTRLLNHGVFLSDND